MNTKLASLFYTTFLTAAVATGSAEAHDPLLPIELAGLPLAVATQQIQILPGAMHMAHGPRRGLNGSDIRGGFFYGGRNGIVPSLLGPLGLMGPLNPLNQRFNNLNSYQFVLPQIPALSSTAAPSQTTTTIIQQSAPHPSQKGGYGVDGAYHFPLLPEHLKPQ